MSFKEWVWACDPIGSLLLVAAATLMLLALNWAGGAYPWSDPHVCANLTVGIVLFITFCLYGMSFANLHFVQPLTQCRVERQIRWHRRTRFLLYWSQFLAFYICFRYRGMDLLLRHQRRDPAAHSEYWL